MSKYKPKELPSTGLDPAEAAPVVRTRAQVMADWEEKRDDAPAVAEQSAAVPATRPPEPVAAPAVAVPTFVAPVAFVAPALPSADAEPAEQLAVCERGIHGAKAEWKAKVDAANEDFIVAAGPYLCWVHEHKLYKLIKGNDGKTYRSFPKYLREQHDLSERTGYRITQTLPLLTILRGAGYAVADLSARQVDSLHPVRLQHGDDRVVEVWRTACATKKGAQPTPDELEKAKAIIGITTMPDPDVERLELTSLPDPGAVVERAAKLLVPATVREAVRKDPEKVRDLVRVLNAALAEVGGPES
ncbi:hypothetical protein ACIA7S_28555 [Streptomyces sp. NPDC051643]|uniref:hypothetical protein n=1 Tax=Streptomyces sp. NPDC051643 TaxID=3365665 RepID=UPI0037ABB127